MSTDRQESPEHTGERVAASKRGPNRLGMTAGMAGVSALLFFFYLERGFGLFLAIGAIVLGFVARSQARRHHLRTGMANVGIISGLIIGALYPLILYFESIWPM